MADFERTAMDEKRAVSTMETHHAMLLGCPAGDLRRPGWAISVARAEGDPAALLFGQRVLVRILVPVASEAITTETWSGVAVLAPELRAPVAELLRALPPRVLLSAPGLAALDTIVRGQTRGEITGAPAAHRHIRYTFPGSFRPYVGSWLEWIEPLDEMREMAPTALGLLARYTAGVLVVRRAGAIVAYAAMRAPSPHVWEIEAHIEREDLREHGLGRALVSRATRAALAAGRLPVVSHAATEVAPARLTDALGYRLYAHAVLYTAPV